jgi:Flp pilus assembly protein TadG
MPALRRPAGRRDQESGSTAIEFVLWTPLLLIMLIALVELGLYVFAEHVAATAAQAGARAGRQEEPANGNWRSDVTTAADDWVEGLVGDAANGPITVTPQLFKAPNACTAPMLEVQVSFTMSSLIGGFQAHGMSEGPVENYYPNNC